MVGFLPPISSWMRRRRAEASLVQRSWPDCAGAGEGDGLERRRVDERVAQRAARPGDEVHDALGDARLRGSASTMRQALSGAAEAGFSTTVLPQISAGASFQAGMALGKFHGVISPTTPMRLADGEHVDAVALGGHQHAGQARAFAGEVAEDVDGAAHFALRFGQRLAFLARHLGGQLLEPAVQDVGGLEQDGAARRAR